MAVSPFRSLRPSGFDLFHDLGDVGLLSAASRARRIVCLGHGAGLHRSGAKRSRTRLIATTSGLSKAYRKSLDYGRRWLCDHHGEFRRPCLARVGDLCSSCPNFDELKPIGQGTARGPRLDAIPQLPNDDYALVLERYPEIPDSGVWSLAIASDDGSRLLLDGELVADNDGPRPPQVASGRRRLEKGRHPVRIEFLWRRSVQSASVKPWFRPSGPRLPGRLSNADNSAGFAPYDP